MFLRIMSAALLAIAAGAACATIDINRADQADLETVKGIGPSLSQRILDERAQGPFRDWADVIRRLPGVGPGSAARLSRGGLTVGGRPYEGAAGARPEAGNGSAVPAASRP